MLQELLNQEVAGYKLEKIYNESSTTTFSATHIESGHNFAFKAIPKSCLVEVPIVTIIEFFQEIKTWQVTNLLSIIDNGIQDNYIWIARPWQDCLNLWRLCQSNNCFEFAYVAQLMAQCAEFLDTLQQSGYRHGNLKPSNIWLANGSLLFSDFCLGADILDIRYENSVSPYYLAPEQISAPQDVDIFADLYSLGVIFYEMLAGHLPYQGTYQQVIEQHLNAPIPTLDIANLKIPPIAQEWLNKLLAKTPQERFLNPLEFFQQIQDFLKDYQFSTTPNSQETTKKVRPIVGKQAIHPDDLKELMDISQTSKKKFKIKREFSTQLRIPKQNSSESKQDITPIATVPKEQVVLEPKKTLPFAPANFDAEDALASFPLPKNAEEEIISPLSTFSSENKNPIIPQSIENQYIYTSPQIFSQPIESQQAPQAPQIFFQPIESQQAPQIFSQPVENPYIYTSPQIFPQNIGNQYNIVQPPSQISSVQVYYNDNFLRPGLEAPPSGTWEAQENVIKTEEKITIAPPSEENSIPPTEAISLQPDLSQGGTHQKLANTQQYSIPKRNLNTKVAKVVIGVKEKPQKSIFPMIITIFAGFGLGLFLFFCYKISYEAEKNNTLSLKTPRVIDTNIAQQEPNAQPKLPTTVVAPLKKATEKTPTKSKNLGWFSEEMPEGMIKDSKAGKYFWQKDLSLMVYIPEGDFFRSSKQKIIVSNFYLDCYELTNAQFLKFCLSSGYEIPKHSSQAGFNLPNQPIVGINWYDAKRYADWAEKRLPTEAEWEKAARGGFQIPDYSNSNAPIKMKKNTIVNRNYPWGSKSPEELNSVSNYNSPKDPFPNTAPVGSFSRGESPYQCQDMAGNVWEWCQDTYDEKYYKTISEKDPVGPNTSSRKKVCRGGSWNSPATQLNTFARWPVEANTKSHNIGIRLAK